MSAPRVVLAAVAVAALATGVYWVVRLANTPADDPGDVGEWIDDPEPTADLAPGERFEKVGSVSRDAYESFPGRISNVGSVPVRAPRGMRVAVVEIVKDEGDFVKKGDVLLRFNKEEILRAIEKAEKDGDEARLAELRVYLEHADLRSPADGQVLDVFTELGRVPLDDGLPMMNIADRNSFTLRVVVPSTLTKTVANIGAKLTADLEANLGRATGTVATHEQADEGWITLVIGLDPKEGYENDMKATLRVPTSKQEVALVPKAAVTQRGDVKIVRVWEPSDRSVGERTILADGDQGDSWIVVAGVFPGENVVVPTPANR